MDWTHLSDKEIKATRKDHKCEWCPEPINKGDAAKYRSYFCEGKMGSGYTHPECWNAISRSQRAILDYDGFSLHEQERGEILE